MEIHRPNIQSHKQVQAEEKKLRGAPHDDLKYVPKEYKNVSQGLEKQFAKYMVDQMHKASGEAAPTDTAMSYYKDLLHTEESQMLSSVNNGLGIQKLILDQIYPKKFRNKEALAAFNQSQQNSMIKKNQIEMSGPPSKEEIQMRSKNVSIDGQEVSHE